MKKISVLCALPSERNTGMATVDLAAYSVIRRLAPQAEITMYAYGKPNKYAYQPGDLPYQHLDVREHADRYFQSDIFLFWGDFIHSHSYLELDRGAWGSKEEKALMKRYGHYAFLSDLPEQRLQKAIVFGSTIITNEAADALDPVYYQHYSRFFSHAGAVYFRDALSAAKVSSLRQSEATLACDCVFLLQNDDLKQLPGFSQAEERKGVGVFFGRSTSKLRMMWFSRFVGKQLGEECKWIPWFSSRRLFRWLARGAGYCIPEGETDPGVILSQVSGCRYIVTDTYHLCINAWRMGIPAICIGQGAQMLPTSLGDKKKEILYEMLGARQFYMFNESLRSVFSFFTEARRVCAVLANRELAAQVCTLMAEQREMAERRLGDALRAMLGSE